VKVRKSSALPTVMEGGRKVTGKRSCGKVILCPSLDVTQERSAAKARTPGAFNRGGCDDQYLQRQTGTAPLSDVDGEPC